MFRLSLFLSNVYVIMFQRDFNLWLRTARIVQYL